MRPILSFSATRGVCLAAIIGGWTMTSGAADAANLVGAVSSTAGGAVGAVTGLLGGGGGGNGTSGGGAGGGAAPRGGGATSPSLASFLTGSPDGSTGGGSGGTNGDGLHFGGGGNDATNDDGFVLRARGEGNVGYNVMVTKKIFSW